VTLLAAYTVVSAGLQGQQIKATEYQVKAAYLYNFGRFVNWSAGTQPRDSGPFSVCVIGTDPFGPSLEGTLGGETIDQRKVVTRRISKPQEATSCQILFVSASESGRLKDIFPAIEKMNVLTVSDIPGFSEHGGMIQFVAQRDKIRFEVNLSNIERAGLSLSSELLKVAVTVRRNS
jgi:hypothetical protein